MTGPATGPGRRRQVARGAVVVLLCSAVGAGIAAAGDAERWRVVVRDEAGTVTAQAPLPPSGRFSLAYTHSYYRVSATETFQAREGSFRLVAVESPSEAVLDYYALEGQRSRDEQGWVLRPSGTPELERLPLVATELGQRTLVVAGAPLPLYVSAGAARHVVVDVEGRDPRSR